MQQKIRVLVVDDSASVRQTLVQIIDDDPDLTVIGTASDPYVAAARIEKEIPDVIILDVEMPRMDGVTFLRKIMSQRPIPVVMCSTLTEEGSETLLDAMEAGAVDVICKPRVDTKHFLTESRVRICDAIKGAAHARLGTRSAAPKRRTVEAKLTADVIMPAPASRQAMARTTERVICIGASTGGTESLREILEVLPSDSPGIVIVQHMPEKFTASFAKRLDGLCQVDVKEAADGDTVLPGRVLIAPGNRHMLLNRSGARYHVTIKDGPLVSRHRPSVDVLFRSAARYAGPNAVGIIMTGMGDDGARGLLEMKTAGAATVAQNEETCTVFGMPKEAIALGGVDKIVPLDLIPHEILRARSHEDHAGDAGSILRRGTAR
jgi:two-component system chemotaxis response regulator CheB